MASPSVQVRCVITGEVGEITPAFSHRLLTDKIFILNYLKIDLSVGSIGLLEDHNKSLQMFEAFQSIEHSILYTSNL